MKFKFFGICIFFAIYILSSHIVVLQTEVGDACEPKGGGLGVCKYTHDCLYAKELFDRFKIRPSRCGFNGTTPIICCGEKITAPQLTTPKTITIIETKATTQSPVKSEINTKSPKPLNPPIQKRISEKKCDEYSSRVKDIVRILSLAADSEVITMTTAKCKFDSTELVVGGKDAKLGEFPHMAAIGWDLNGKDYRWLCGGSLISEDYILTAAHCSFYSGTQVASRVPKVVRLGEHNINCTDDGATPYDVLIANMTLHPMYNSKRKYYDIALFQLQESVLTKFSDFIRPACLWTKQDLEDEAGTVIGWGTTSYKGDPSNILQVVKLSLVESEKCSLLFTQNRKLRSGILKEQICAGNLTGGHDACQGDSGGPLQVYSKENRCIHYLVGITSFGNGCAFENTLGVYTRVSSYIKWIEDIVWPNQS